MESNVTGLDKGRRRKSYATNNLNRINGIIIMNSVAQIKNGKSSPGCKDASPGTCSNKNTKR